MSFLDFFLNLLNITKKESKSRKDKEEPITISQCNPIGGKEDGGKKIFDVTRTVKFQVAAGDNNQYTIEVKGSHSDRVDPRIIKIGPGQSRDMKILDDVKFGTNIDFTIIGQNCVQPLSELPKMCVKE